AADEYRHHEHAFVLQRRRHLEPHNIVGIVEAPRLVTRVLHRQPFVADDDEHDRAARQRALHRFDEVLPGRNAVGVLEDSFDSKTRGQQGCKSQHMAAGIFTSIADEDAITTGRIGCGRSTGGHVWLARRYITQLGARTLALVTAARLTSLLEGETSLN